jgi:Lipase (class 3)
MQKPPPVYSTDLVLHPSHDSSYLHFEHAAAHPFQADPAGTMPRVNAWWLAEAALASYWPPNQARDLYAAAGLESEYVSDDATNCYVCWNDTAVIVAFRGTEPDDWRDVLTDIEIHLDPWRTGHVHHGFKQAMQSIWGQLTTTLAALATGRHVWFCGHSLGAALAALSADSWSVTRGVCTFGSPMIGDHAFTTGFNADLGDRSLRYVNHHDVVARVPPSALGYAHVDTLRYIARDGTVSDRIALLQSFFSELFGQTEVLLEMMHALEHGSMRTAPTFVLDHMPKAYAIWTWNDYDARG